MPDSCPKCSSEDKDKVRQECFVSIGGWHSDWHAWRKTYFKEYDFLESVRSSESRRRCSCCPIHVGGAE